MLKKLPNNSNDGILSREELEKIPGYPGLDAIEKGRIIIAECDEDIPCNPCEEICKQGAIIIGKPITNLPTVDPEKCDGCGACLRVCPGLCIFMIEKNYTDDQSLIFIPHELYPLPEKGQIIKGCDLKGENICDAVVEKIIKVKNNKTAVISIKIPKKYFNVVRSIQFKGD